MNPNDPEQLAQLRKADRKKLKQIYITLMVSGLAIGAVLSVGIFMAMSHFGLTQRPQQIERQQG